MTTGVAQEGAPLATRSSVYFFFSEARKASGRGHPAAPVVPGGRSDWPRRAFGGAIRQGEAFASMMSRRRSGF